MYDCYILTYWITDAQGNRPALADLLQPGDSCSDATGQNALSIAPDPNAVVWQLRCSADTLAAIEADPDHVVLSAGEVVEDAAV